MKYTIFVATLVALFTFASCDSKTGATAIHGIADIAQADEWCQDDVLYGGGEVYVCTGNSSKKYHSTLDCRFLENCKGEVRKVDQHFAEDKGRTPCKNCCNYQN